MKQIFLSFLVCTGIMLSVKAQPAPADVVLKEAYRQAAKEGKNVFVIFHASWCGWCHKMDTSMNDPSCQQFFNDNYIVRHLVVNESKDKQQLENPGAEGLKVKYNGEGQGIPFWLIFDKDGKLLADSKMRGVGDGPDKGENAGCPATEKEVAFFVDILRKTSKLDQSQLDIIARRFRKND